MARPRPNPYQPPEEQLKLFPEISGNAINGLGKSERRRPTPIYWHRPETLAHGALQVYMVERFNRVPAYHEVYARPGARGPKSEPVAEVRAEDTPANWARRVKAFALEHEADLVGIARFDPAWTFEGYEVSEPWIIVLGVAMDQPRLAAAPSSDVDTTSALEVAEQYNRGARASRLLANWVREQGWQAAAHAGPWAGAVTLVPPALACGFGELGKHGSIINRAYGSSFRLAGVVTDLPLVAEASDSFGADDFCLNCRVCTDACPPDAIFREKQMVRGTVKWFVDFDKCIPYFNDTHGCGICIAVCPWSRPGVAPRLAEKMSRRRNRLAET
jgi:Pyruvate/2-oxoacid:ferredoxin oxidoreductase delta subunit